MNYVVIPALEPDQQLLRLLSQMPEQSEYMCIIVDDGSSDKYGSIFEYAHNFGVVLTHEKNRGKGEALKTAFSYIMETNKEPGSVIITADADGQHRIEDIIAVAAESRRHPYELVIGSRRLDGRVPLKSKIGNIITRKVFSLASGVRVYDTQSGLRGFSMALLPFMCSVEGSRYEYEMNMLMEASNCIAIRELPIETIYLNKNKSSHFRPFQDAVLIYKNLLKFAMASIISFFTDYGIYMLFVALLADTSPGGRLIISNVAARICSAFVNYTLNRKYVFKDGKNVWKTGSQYFVLAGFILLLDTWLVTLLGGAAGLGPYLGKILADIFLFFLSWFVQQRFIFKKSANKKGSMNI